MVYRTFRRGSETDISWVTLDAALRQLKKRLLGKGPYGVKKRGWEEYEQVKGLRSVMRRAKHLLGECKEGDQVWVKVQSGSIYSVAVGKLNIVAPPFPNVTHTAAAKRIWDFVFKEAMRLEVELGRQLRVVSMGIYNYRYIDGTHTWSQHAWGNGFDFIILHEGETDGRAMAVVTDELRHKDYVSEVLWQVANHYGHAHISGDPKRTGTP